MSDAVPLAEAVQRFLTDPAARVDAAALYRRLHAEAPILDLSPRLAVAASHDAVTAVLGDDRFVTSPDAVWPGLRLSPSALIDGYLRAMLPMRAPADHERLRRLVVHAFTWRVIQRLRPRMEAIVDALLEPVLAQGRMDMVADLAHPLPLLVSAAMLDLPPDDRPRLLGWADVVTRQIMAFDQPAEEVARAEAAVGQFAEYVRDVCAARRRAPIAGDLLSALAAGAGDGDVLDAQELIAVCMNLIIAGHETSTGMIANSILTLLRCPGALERLRAEPGLLGPALDECLRLEPPVAATARVAADAVEVLGCPIRRGQTVLVLLGAAGRDPRRHPEPDRFAPGPQRAPHVAFGHGAHYCLGHALARVQGQIVLERFLRLAEPRLAVAAADIAWSPTLAFHTPRTLPITFRPAPRVPLPAPPGT
jgi:unspecific monooxygenase